MVDELASLDKHFASRSETYFPGADFVQGIPSFHSEFVEGFGPPFLAKDNGFLTIVEKRDFDREASIGCMRVDGRSRYPDSTPITGDECFPCDFGGVYCRFGLLASGVGLPLCLRSQLRQIAYGGFDIGSVGDFTISQK